MQVAHLPLPKPSPAMSLLGLGMDVAYASHQMACLRARRAACLDKGPAVSLLLFISSPNSSGFFHHFFLFPKEIPPRELGDQQQSM